jgi:hypothetical protein
MGSLKPLDLYLNGCRIRLPLRADMHDSVSLLIAGIDIISQQEISADIIRFVCLLCHSSLHHDLSFPRPHTACTH